MAESEAVDEDNASESDVSSSNRSNGDGNVDDERGHEEQQGRRRRDVSEPDCADKDGLDDDVQRDTESYKDEIGGSGI